MTENNDMTAKPSTQNSTAQPAGIKERLDFNEDFKLDWHDPDEATDGYQLKWIGKDYARLQSGTAPRTVIIPDSEHNAKPENSDSGNIFLTGDNLEALKHLQNAYRNSVDMIYIDPPYNTGKEFTYNDKFDFSDEKLKDMLGLTDIEIKRLHTINGRSSHSAWLTFMYPRLKLARTLLKDSGVIFISIDDNEQANLKLLCDEIFGEGNFVNNFIWLTGKGKKDTWSRTTEQYILCYAKDKSSLPAFSEIQLAQGNFSNPDNDPRGEWFSGSISFDEKRSNEERDTYFSITSPSGEVWTRQWLVESKEEMDSLLKDNRIYFGPAPDYKNVPRKKIFPFDENEIIPTNLLDSYGTTVSAQTELNKLFAMNSKQNIFDNPKPVALIAHIIYLLMKKELLILDFFAGSGTTAHAVMQLNAEDGGERKWILCNIDEPTKEDSEAYKAGYKTIDEISVERIKRAAAQIGDTSGFKRYFVKEPAAQTLDKITEFDPAQNILIPDDMVAAMGGEAVILHTWLVADGYKLDYKPREIDIAGYTAYYCGNSMLYIINQGWGKEQTKELLNRIGTHTLNVNTIICYGYSFPLESMRELEINVKQSLHNQVQIETRY